MPERLRQISDCMDILEAIRNFRKANPGEQLMGCITGELDTLSELHGLVHDPEWAEGNGH